MAKTIGRDQSGVWRGVLQFQQVFKFNQVIIDLACDTTRARYKFLSDPQLVVDSYFHGLVSAHPRTRYRPGIDAVLYYTISAHFPTALQDWWFNVSVNVIFSTLTLRSTRPTLSSIQMIVLENDSH